MEICVPGTNLYRTRRVAMGHPLRRTRHRLPTSGLTWLPGIAAQTHNRSVSNPRPSAPTSQTKLSGNQSRYDLYRTSRPCFCFSANIFCCRGKRGTPPPPSVVELERGLARALFHNSKVLSSTLHIFRCWVVTRLGTRLVVDSITKNIFIKTKNMVVRFATVHTD